MTRRAPSRIDRAIEPSLKTVARGASYFTKNDVVHEVLRRAGVADAIIDIRRSYVGYGLDGAILRYIEVEVGRALQQRDEAGLRLFECFADGTADRRWRRFTKMTAIDLRAVVRDAKTLRKQLDDKIVLYELFLEELERLGKGACVEQVYDDVCRQLLGSPLRGVA